MAVQIQEAQLAPYSAVRAVGPGPALVLAPHPDDEVLGCGGAILRHRAAGDRVRVVVVTDGGQAPGVDRKSYVNTRRAESERALRLLGCEPPRFWEYQDRSLEYGEELVRRIGEEIEECGAEIVYAPSPDELHPDHNALGLCALEAVRRSPREVRAALYEVSTPLRANLLLDITDLEKRKREAIGCFESQLQGHALDEQILALNRYRSYTLPAEVRSAEAYRVLTRSELRADPLQAFADPAMPGLEARVRRGALGAPLVSVIVRTCGRETLGDALVSIAAQTWPHIEVIVVVAKGPAPTPQTLARAGRFPVRLVGGEEPLGRSQAANAGLLHARGAFVSFLDDDDWLYPGHIAKLHEALSIHRYARAAYDAIEMIEAEPGGGRRCVSRYGEPWEPARLLCENYIPIHAVLFHRSLVSEDGCRFDDALPFCEDWDFWIQLSRQTPFVYVPEPGGAYRLPGGSALYDRSSDAAGRGIEAVLAKWSGKWTRSEMGRLWDAARRELTPRLRQEREEEIARVRAEAEQARSALVREQQAALASERDKWLAAEARLRAEALDGRLEALDVRAALEAALSKEREQRAAEEAGRRCAESERAQVQAALDAMASSSAVRAARLVRRVSEPLHAALGRMGRGLLGGGRPLTLPQPDDGMRTGAWLSCPESCQREPVVHRSELVDYSARETTPDQAEIEWFLAAAALEGKRILHVGVGNSGLARKLAPRCRTVEGVTVSEAEQARAAGLGIANYRVHLVNKHDPRFARLFDAPFEVIVDNNLSSYACCKRHFQSMFGAYAAWLPPGGELITHKLGMEWSAEDPRWRLTDEDLERLGGSFGFALERKGAVRVLRRV